MAQTFKTITVSHCNFGNVKVKIDSEDFNLLKDKNLYVKIDNTKDNYPPRIWFKEENNGMVYAHRYILESHRLLENSKNYGPKNGDWFDLRKKNFI